MELKGKVCIVTGGGSGIGKAACELFTNLGAKVIICDINTKDGEELAETLNSQHGTNVAFFSKCDVTDIDNFRESFKIAKDKFHNVDIVCNNAGIWNDSPSSWSREIDINFKGVVNGCILAMEFMGTKNGGKGGTVVNSASLLGLCVMPIMPIYGATKGAVVSLTRNLGSDVMFELNKICYMAVCPNATGTKLFDGMENNFLLPYEEMMTNFKKLADQIPFQKPESVAKCMVEMINCGINGSIWLSEYDEPAKLVQITDVSVIKSPSCPTLVKQVN